MTENYIFDFGKVLVNFDEYEMTANYIADEKDIALCQSVIFDRLYWDKLDEGAISDADVRAGICSRLPERLHRVACTVYDRWFDDLPLVDGMSEIIADLKKRGKKVYLLSNISERFAANYSSVPKLRALFEPFDGLVFSAPLHLVKPNADIFEYLLQKYQLKAEECMFIDDREKNVATAKQLGMQGYCFDGSAEKLRKVLFA